VVRRVWLGILERSRLVDFSENSIIAGGGAPPQVDGLGLRWGGGWLGVVGWGRRVVWETLREGVTPVDKIFSQITFFFTGGRRVEYLLFSFYHVAPFPC